MTQSRTKTEVLDSISLDLISIQVEGKIVYINTAGAKMLGAATPGQLVGKTMLDFVHPDYQEIAIERVRQVITEGIAVCPSEETWLRIDGTAIDVDVAAMPIFYEGKLATQLIVRQDGRCMPRRPARDWRSARRSWRKR